MNTVPQLVIFDLDGTITKPVLDFDQIRAEIGLESGTVLEALQDRDPQQRAHAMGVIERHERLAAETCELQDGASEVLAHLRSLDIRVAIATRNSRRSVRTVLGRFGLEVDDVYSRDDGPVKPSPEPVQRICRRMGIAPQRVWMVGDYLYDLQCGRAAGTSTVLLINDDVVPGYAAEADRTIRQLQELIVMLEETPSE